MMKSQHVIITLLVPQQYHAQNLTAACIVSGRFFFKNIACGLTTSTRD